MIKIDWTIILQFANFLVLMFILNALLYRPLRAAMARRREEVQGGHERARGLAEQVEEKMTRYQEQLQEAKQKGAKEKAALRQQAGSEEGEILGAAHQEAADHVQKIKRQVAEEAAEARSALKSQTDELGRMIATKVLGRAL